MTATIFLSHNHNDKPVVEPIALRLREIFGEEQVFYDSWSIEPGDGIIDKINKGLERPEFVFFFVSSNSLKSKMVSLEWQNALYKATKGECRIIPVRVDGCNMPSVLLQNLYIDMFSMGIEATLTNIINMVQGDNAFIPQHTEFSNLTYSIKKTDDSLIVTVSASHLMQPNPSFLVLSNNNKDEISVGFAGSGMAKTNFFKDVQLDNGKTYNGFYLSPSGISIRPNFPFLLKIAPQKNNRISFEGLMYEIAAGKWRTMPQKN